MKECMDYVLWDYALWDYVLWDYVLWKIPVGLVDIYFHNPKGAMA
jgi:hypothetical protein